MWPLLNRNTVSCKLMIIRTLIILASVTAIFHVSLYILETKQQVMSNVHTETAEQPIENLLLETLIFIQRREHLSEMCQTYASLHRNVFDNTKDLDHVLVDEKHKLLYCYVPKVACTNWKRVFMVLLGSAGQTNASSIPAEVVHNQSAFPKLSDYTFDEVKFFVANFTKYLFVRHPFERLLSAFRNKLEKPSHGSKYFRRRIGRDIIKHYRINATNHSLEYGNDVTFEEFAMYLTDHYVPAFNEHWKPIKPFHTYTICIRCRMNDIVLIVFTRCKNRDAILVNSCAKLYFELSE